jgi:meso-butanediol dehydrogenase/(S,S)-butanediol dehydrogenase/diacetyl reductase
MAGRLENKVALISGAASGIGEATARTFAAQGARVVIADKNQDEGARVATEIGNAGGIAEFVATDIFDPANLEAAVEHATSRFGRLDILHNNAMSTWWGRIGELTLDQWKRSLDGGLTSYWYASKLAVEVMLGQGGGAIVNTASVSGLAADWGLGAYNVAKAGIVNMTRAFAIEYARKGIRCNAVCPGPIFTPPIARAKQTRPDIHEKIREAIPMGRFGEPQEIANVVLFLASDEASFVTGAAVVADGGLWSHSGMPSLNGEAADWGSQE